VASGGSNSEDADSKRPKLVGAYGTFGTPPSFFSMDRIGTFQAFFPKIKVWEPLVV